MSVSATSELTQTVPAAAQNRAAGDNRGTIDARGEQWPFPRYVPVSIGTLQETTGSSETARGVRRFTWRPARPVAPR